jgi:hypothetical protein
MLRKADVTIRLILAMVGGLRLLWGLPAFHRPHGLKIEEELGLTHALGMGG